MAHENVGYSTLEVSHNDHSQKEVAPSYADNNLPQAVHPDGQHHQAPEYYKPEGAVPAPYYEATEAKQQYAVDQSAFGGQSRERRTRCGLAPKTFWIVAAAVTLGIIAAIVGGVVGGVLSNRNSTSNDNSSSQQGGSGSNNNNGTDSPGATANSTAVSLLSTSKLAAVNWTDARSFSHYAVFSQDTTNALMVSIWDSQNQTWSAVNISSRLASSGNSIRAKPGTPLTAVSTGPPGWPFQMDLYYLTPSNNIQEVYSRDQDGATWGIGDLGKSPKTVDEDSPLSSIWHRCEAGCSGFIYVTYLSNNRVQLVNGSDWSQTTTLPIGPVDAGSPLALFPFTGYDAKMPSGFNAFGQDPELRLYVTEDGGNLGEYKYTVDKQWVGGHGIASNLPNNPLPQIAGAPFDNWFSSQLTVLNNDGSLSVAYWDNATSTWEPLTHANMKGAEGAATGGFEAIAQHHERRLYAAVNGTVMEYRWEAAEPGTLISVGRVALATDDVK
ncbi:hypothetical protein GE09DRAFT_1228050 [Coniochaeta sp. 2T2.1]|nr:hypothetical protein GE09DRAFT_1228050 [Coniochaeta sp. 2T2.1]